MRRAVAVERIPVKLTYADYLTWSDDGRRYELYEGELQMVPSPSVRHQRLCRNLELLLGVFVSRHQRGEVLHAPLDVVFSEDIFVQPDILFVSQERGHIIGSQHIAGAPDLVVEVLSPGTEPRDRTYKLQLYCRYGVREYWLVDPETETVEVLALSLDGAQLEGRYGADDIVSSQVLAGLQFRVREILPGYTKQQGDRSVLGET